MASAEKIEHLLTSIYQDSDGEPTSAIKKLRLVLSHPVVALAAIGYILRLPEVLVATPESGGSSISWLYDPRRPWKLHGFVSSYVELPSPLHLYWKGQAKQNLRKSTARARMAGFKVRPVDTSETSSVIGQVFSDKGWEADAIEAMQRTFHESHKDSFCVAVFDEFEHAVAFCIGDQVGNAVRNVWANSSQKGQVRWLCFTGFVEEASERGAKYIVESPPWAMYEGNRVFALRLGFSPARIRSGSHRN